MMTRMKMNRPSLLVSPLLISLLLGTAHANTGNKFCACMPSTFVFTFDFSLGCTDDISSDDPGITAFTCKVSGVGGDTPSDPVPVVVNDIQIIEIGQPTRSQIISTTTVTGEAYKNGDVFEWMSTADISFPISDDAPKTMQVLMTGSNAAGEALINLWAIEFTNQCDVWPVLTPGMQAGWMVMTDLGNPITEVCPASPGPEPPTPAPVAGPTAPTAPAPTVAPVVAPTVTEMPSEIPSSVPTVKAGAPSTLPTIPKTTAAPTAATTGTAAPTPATATGTPTTAPVAAGTATPTAAAPVPAPPASCDDLETTYNECASANFVDGQQEECGSCLAGSFPTTGSDCAIFGPQICTAIVTCPCEPCEAPLELYTECLLAQIGLPCDLNCTLTPASPTTPLVTPSVAPAAVPTATTAAPSVATPTATTAAPSVATPTATTVAPSVAAPTSTTATPTAAATSDAPSDMPSSVPSSLSGAPAAPSAVAPTAVAPTPPASCDDITAAYNLCVTTNFADGQKTECESCVTTSIPTSGAGCDAFGPAVCTAIYTTCNCTGCTTELEAYTECLFARAGLPCQFDCSA